MVVEPVYSNSLLEGGQSPVYADHFRIGNAILRAQGWEEEAEENFNVEFPLEWPLAKLTKKSTGRGMVEKHSRPVPTADAVRERVKQEELEGWLNSEDSTPWRVRNFYVTSVQLVQ
jgi:hypothetical protein